MLHRVIRGAAVEADAFFRDENGVPLQLAAAPTWTLRDPDGNLVLTDTAVADVGDPARWTADFTIPASVPIPVDGAPYQLDWSAPMVGGGNAYSAERFEVVFQFNGAVPASNDQIILAGKPLSDALYLEAPADAGTVTFSVLDTTNNTQIAETAAINPEAGLVNGQTVYVARGLPTTGLNTQQYIYAGFQPMLGIWTYEVGNLVLQEAHAIYVVDPYVLGSIMRLKASIDAANIGRIHNVLNWNEARLMHALMRGVERFNGTGSTFTAFSMATMPAQAAYLILECAKVEALRSQAIAEKYHEFQFNSEGLSLEVAYADFLQGMADSINSDLYQQITDWKKYWVQRGGGLTGALPGTQGNGLPRGRVASLRTGFTPVTNYTVQGLSWNNLYAGYMLGISPYRYIT